MLSKNPGFFPALRGTYPQFMWFCLLHSHYRTFIENIFISRVVHTSLFIKCFKELMPHKSYFLMNLFIYLLKLLAYYILCHYFTISDVTVLHCVFIVNLTISFIILDFFIFTYMKLHLVYFWLCVFCCLRRSKTTTAIKTGSRASF